MSYLSIDLGRTYAALEIHPQNRSGPLLSGWPSDRIGPPFIIGCCTPEKEFLQRSMVGVSVR